MKVVSESRGYFLVFDDVEDLETVVKYLQGFLEYAKSDTAKGPPYLYAVYDSRVTADEMRSAIKDLKRKLGGKSNA